MMVAELARIVDLMVLGGARPRHDDARHADGGKLGDRRCAGSRHHQIGCGIHQRHPVLVSKHSIHDAVAAIASGRGIGQIALADDVVDGQIAPVGKPLDHLRDDLVQPPGAQRAADDGEHESVVWQAELRTRRHAVAGAIDVQHLLANRRAGELRSRQRRSVEGHRTSRGAARHQPRHQAGSAVVADHDDTARGSASPRPWRESWRIRRR